MTYEPLNRRVALLAAVFAFLGVILGTIALATNYWTLISRVEPVYNGTSLAASREGGYRWNVSIARRRFFSPYFQINL